MSRASEVTIRANGANYRVKAPEYGYTSIIALALIHTPLMPKGYAIWDNDSAIDRRMCRATFLLDATEMQRLIGVFVGSGRGISVSLILPATSGFFPFGPDKGDGGTFGCRLISLKPGPLLEEPWQYFRCEVELVAESFPAYALPTEVTDGALQIGTISGLRYPPGFPASRSTHGFETVTTTDGTPYTVDKTNDADFQETTLPMACNQSKAAALIDHMVGTVRDNNVNLIAQGGNYLFGREAGASATYVCQWLDESISIQHQMFDEFGFNLRFYRVSG